MIKFFRNIKKKFAAENKVASYLRFAIGEIILVVIRTLIMKYSTTGNTYESKINKRKFARRN